MEQWLRRLHIRLTNAARAGTISQENVTETERRIIATRLQQLDALLERARTLPAMWGHKIEARAGDTVYLRHKDTIRALTLVSTWQADPGNGKISVVSPLGQAILGRGQGEHVRLLTLDGDLTYEILKIV